MHMLCSNRLAHCLAFKRQSIADLQRIGGSSEARRRRRCGLTQRLWTNSHTFPHQQRETKRMAWFERGRACYFFAMQHIAANSLKYSRCLVVVNLCFNKDMSRSVGWSLIKPNSRAGPFFESVPPKKTPVNVSHTV